MTASLQDPRPTLAGLYSAEVGLGFSSNELRASGGCTVGGRVGRSSCDAALAHPGGAQPWASFMAMAVTFRAAKGANAAEMAVKLRSALTPCPAPTAEARRRQRRLASDSPSLLTEHPSYVYSSASGVPVGGSDTAVRGYHGTWATSPAGFVIEVLVGAVIGPTARFAVALEAPAPRVLPSGYFRDEDQVVAFVIEEGLFWWYVGSDCEGNMGNCPAPDHLTVSSCVAAFACTGEATGLDPAKSYLFVVSIFLMFPWVAEEAMGVRWRVETAGAAGGGAAVGQAPRPSDVGYRLDARISQAWLSRD